MPGWPFPCLNTIQPIFGCDIHTAIPPQVPTPMPHPVVWGVGWSQKINVLGMAVSKSKASSPESGQIRPVQAGWGYSVGRTHDAGPHPAHLYPNVLLFTIMLGSSAKHEFGSGTVKVPGGHDMGIGVMYVFDKPLDCNDPCAFPTSQAITATNTVRAGFTFSDFLRGTVQMAVDTAIDYLTGLIGKGIIRGPAKLLGRVAGSVASRAASRAGREVAEEVAERVPRQTPLGKMAEDLQNWASKSRINSQMGDHGVSQGIDGWINGLFREDSNGTD